MAEALEAPEGMLGEEFFLDLELGGRVRSKAGLSRGAKLFLKAGLKRADDPHTRMIAAIGGTVKRASPRPTFTTLSTYTLLAR